MLNDPVSWVGLSAGAVIGAAAGAIAQASNFCSVGAVGDIVLARDSRRLRSWLMAAAVAVIGTQAIAFLGIFVLNAAIYRLPRIDWLSVGCGGLAFGYGMAMAGGCIQRALVRVGAGSLRSLLTLVLAAVTGFLTLKYIVGNGGLGRMRNALRTDGPATLDSLAAMVGLKPAVAALVCAGVLGAALLWYCLKDSWFRGSRAHLWGGAGIGAAVVAAWAASSLRRSPPEGMNLLFALTDSAGAPVAQTWGFASFPMGLLAGMVVGSFAVAAARGDLMLDRFVDGEDLKRHVMGGVLMGAGGALAHGCSFGQGLSGFSALSIDAFIAIAAMTAGCLWGVRALEAGSAWGGLRLCFRRA
jgi:hypothetical protein